ncbi:MAG: adenylate/guanylate cyclase domain-containing protein [Thermodesulfobacteriota bacterium]
MAVRMGIKIKLAALLAALGFLTTFSMGAVLISHQKASLEAQMRTMAGTITEELAGDSKIPLMQQDSLAMNLLVESMLEYPGIYDAYILNDRQGIEAHMHLGAVGTKYPGVDGPLRGEGRPPWLIKEEAGNITFASPIVFRGTTVGYTVISFSDEFIQERVWVAIAKALVITFVATVIVALAALPLANVILRPVFRLLEATREVALGNYDHRVPEKPGDEIGDLEASFNAMATELKKKEVLKGVFNRYVSSHVADEILKEPESITLGGDRRDATIFFSDIRGFTPMSRRLLPEVTVDILNRYFTLASEAIFRFDGTVDKFIGDAVMAVFGSPIGNARHLEMGVKAAATIRSAVDHLNGTRLKKGLAPLYLGIGLDTGTVIVGNMGSQARMEYTAVGEAVNMASRLTDMARPGEIILSESAYWAVAEHVEAFRTVDVSIKGVEGRSSVYALKAVKGEWKRDVADAVVEIVVELERLGIVA